MDLILVDSEDLRQRPRVQFHPLAGVVDDEVLAVPRQRHSMRFDRVVVVARRPVGEIDRAGSVGECSLGIADQDLDRLTDEAVGRARVRSGLVEGARRRGLVGDLDQRGGVVGLLLGLSEDDRDRLPVPVDAVVLHDGQGAAPGRLGRCQEQRRRLHARGVAVGHYEHDAGGGLRGARVQGGDMTASNRAVAQRGVDHSLHHVLSGEARVASHLQRPVEPGDLRTDETVLVAQHRIVAGLRSPAGGRDRDGRSGVGGAHRQASSVSWCRTAVSVRRVSSTLNALPLSGRASASSASAA